jgi:hypothetical protein
MVSWLSLGFVCLSTQRRYRTFCTKSSALLAGVRFFLFVGVQCGRTATNGAASMTGGGLAVRQGAVTQDRSGRFVGTGGLTEAQRAFVSAYVRNGGDATAAAKIAYPEASRPDAQGWSALRSKRVLEAIRGEQARVVLAEVGSATVATVLDVMRTGGHRERIAAARLGAEMARLVGKASADADRNKKDPADMSQAEVNEEIQRLAREVAELGEAQAMAGAIDGQAVEVSDIAPNTAQIDPDDPVTP